MQQSYVMSPEIIRKRHLPTSVPLPEWDSLWLTFLQAAGLIYLGRRKTEQAAANARGGPTKVRRSRTRTQCRGNTMTAQELLARISDYCRQTGLAESTFGRRAVNDGKLANRLRNGGRITTETVDRIQAFMDANRTAGAFRIYHGGPRPESLAAPDGAPAAPSNLGTARFP